jgi:FemAB-related protein (PEP-CTERM system-associated)
MDGMRIRRLGSDEKQAWDDYVAAHPQALPYHRHAWKDAVEAAYGFEGIYLVAEEQGRIDGVLPLVLFSWPLLGQRLISLPYCDAGGILAENESIAARLLAAARVLAQRPPFSALEIRCGQPLSGQEGGGGGINKVRMVLDLPQGGDKLMSGLKAKLRSQIKKPERDGLYARLGGGELLAEFYAVFAENMRDLGSPVHSRLWFEEILKAFGQQAAVGVIYSPEGRPAAAGILLRNGKLACVPWASSLRRFKQMNPNMLLYWTFLSFAADNGSEKFDFGRSTQGEGSWRFKKQWGAEPEPLYWETFSAEKRWASNAAAGGKSRRLAEAVWRRLPLETTSYLGPKVRRFISL